MRSRFLTLAAAVLVAGCASGRPMTERPQTTMATPSAEATGARDGATRARDGAPETRVDTPEVRTGAAQPAPDPSAARRPADPPALVVVISIDQFRGDYLARFRPHFVDGGFERLLRDGAWFTNAHYAHAVTKTCPGHAAILSGSYANVNGIVSNEWYDPVSGGEMYCAADEDAPLVGAVGEGRSPRNFTGSTVGDALKLAGDSKVIAIAGKDRSAIYLGGLLADGAYWRVDSLFVTSEYYASELPEWVREFNAGRPVMEYAGRTWERLVPDSVYAGLGPDSVDAEDPGEGLGRTFPHRLPGGAGVTAGGAGATAAGADEGESAAEAFLDAFEDTPFPNEVVAELAMRAVEAEDLGGGGGTDLLAIGFSANDRVGHAYGPDSHEVMDITLRTDRLLSELFSFLDERVGPGRTLVVLTADHGVAPLPETLNAIRPGADAGRIDDGSITARVERAMTAAFGAAPADGWVVYHDSPNLYLNEPALAERGIELARAEAVAGDAITEIPGIHRAYTRTELAAGAGIPEGIALSFDPERTGNVHYQARPFWIVEDESGTTHGSTWSYDSHVPVLFYGPGIRPGRYHVSAEVADIAPTLAVLLGVEAPAGSVGRVLWEALE